MSSFTITVTPTSGNGNNDYTVKVQSDGFEGTVDLSCSIDHTATCTLADISVYVPEDSSVVTLCSVGTVIRSSTLTVTGTSGGLQDSDTASITPGSFTVDVSPSSGEGNSDYTVTVTSVNDFEGTVDLACSLAPIAQCSLADISLTVAKGSSAGTLCHVENVIQSGTTLTVSASYTQGGFTIDDSDTASITPGSFSVDVSPSSGDDDSDYDVTVDSTNGFEGTVDLSCSLDPSGYCSLADLSLLVPKGSSKGTTCYVGDLSQVSTLTIAGAFTQNGFTINDDDTSTVNAS